MKRNRRKNIIRSIRQNLNRFLSIMFIVALGAGFMAGLAAASPDMYEAADRYIDEYSLFDLDIKSLIGLTDEDQAACLQTEFVDTVQGARVFDMVLEQEGGSDFTSRVYGILDENSETVLNRLHLMEGSLPKNPDECVVESVFGRYTGEEVRVGDLLTVAAENPDYETLDQYIPNKTLKITGICQSPMCLSIEGDSTNIGSGTINLNVYVREDFFDCDFYTDLFIKLKDSRHFDTFSPDYENYVDAAIEALRPAGMQQSTIRADQMTLKLCEQADILNEFLTLASSVSRVQDALFDARTEGARTLDEISGILPEWSPAPDYCAEAPSVRDLTEKLKEQLEQTDDALTGMEDISWIYRTRKDLAGFESYSSNVGKVSALARIFPVFFFIVALLVALTTMSRLIEEKRLQIGTLKAMGFSNNNILLEYLIFSFLASFTGCLIGLAAGFHIFPSAINAAYSMMYMVPPIETPIRWDIAAWVAPVTIISILLAALWACWNEFRSVPAELMLPKTPAAGKRIWLEYFGFIWKKLSFTYKVTFRNLFRYKKRFIMTIIGVAGCSALLLTGFGIRDSVNEIVNKQFGEIYRYNAVFIVDKPSSVKSDPKISSVLNSPMVQASTCVCQEAGKIHAGRSSQEIVLFVPEEPDRMDQFIHLRNRTTKEQYVLDSGSVILTEKLCEEMNIKPGDTIQLENAAGKIKEVCVRSIAENYVTSFAYMTPEVYRSLFASEPDYTSLLCILPENADTAQSGPDLTASMLESSHVLYGRTVSSLKSSFSDSIQSINGVILVLILAAGLLCIVVLYNLTNVNICERKKELATLKVLGFYDRETQNYIFREINILSFLGSLIGLLAGIWLHGFVVRTIEVNHIMFGREIKPLSFIIAMAISMVFTLIVNLIMKKTINRTDMVEAMKAND